MVTETRFYSRIISLFTFLRVLSSYIPKLDVFVVFGTCHRKTPMCPNAHHIFLSTRWCVVLTDLQLEHIPFPVEGKTAKEFHHSALVSGRKELKTENRRRREHTQLRDFSSILVPVNQEFSKADLILEELIRIK